MNNHLFLKPQKIIGISFKNPNPFIFKRRKGIFFLLSLHSAVILFNLKTLLIRAKSPFLHQKIWISHLGSVKNRTIVVLKYTIQILDYLIPTTRFLFHSEEILFFISTRSCFILYCKLSKKIMMFDPWNFKILFQLILQQGVIDIQHRKCDNNENFILILTNNGNVDIWNIEKNKITNSFNIGTLFPVYSFKFIKNLNSIAFGSNNGKLIIYNINNSKILELNFKEIEKITKIFLSSHLKNIIFIANKKSFILYDFVFKTVKKLNLNCHSGEIYIGHFITTLNLFLTIGISDKNIVLHEYNTIKKEFQIIINRFVNKFPILKIETNIENKNLTICADVARNIYLLKFNYLESLFCINTTNRKYKKFSIDKNRKVRLKIINFQAKILFSEEEKIIYIGICFYNTKNPYFWKISPKKTSEINMYSHNKSNKLGTTVSICFSRNAKFSLIGYDNNFISLFNLSNEKHLFIKKNHIKFKKNQECSINCLSYDKYNEFFISGCSCGYLLLWELSRFKKIKLLDLKKKICLLKWNEKFDIILTATIDNEIQMIIPESFSLIRRCWGHKKKITDFFVIRKSKFLVSTSLDKTIKIWNLFQNECDSTLKFDHSPIAVSIDKSENNLFSCHKNTIGIGLSKIFKKNLRYDCRAFQKNLLEKNGKILLLNKIIFSSGNFSSYLQFNQKLVPKNRKHMLSVFRNYNYIKNLKNIKFYFLNDFLSNELEYYKLCNKKIIKFFENQLKYNQIHLENFNLFFFLLETSIDNITCKLNLKISLDFILYIFKEIRQIVYIQSNFENLFKRILVELMKQRQKLNK